ncbi:hypothetical protein TPHA_0A01840 [Tetrapisispora phaffii CBS 4417]|uniref:Transmembrane 9 superfamily member n=1 Tax=Tetrapisispora phaffii (strain ATCC 24235 / CBS 4417 / NBRC 1672 / NRRL Y-8282 / UCD 70-5) TaxID=1071381 RepID=G8BMY9_TETPH|nr:hypothetical protein TPHA_0A01840 [Tetrapisispora phaffii CBS 4417]CCE61267.1 hypothetical protein TPHA_0A01840 [Tetrapisispora phaffii CBS 4417]
MRCSYLLIAALVSFCNAFYLPGVAPSTYNEGDELPLLVNHLTPSLNYQKKDDLGKKVESREKMLYSFDYYFPKLHFCKPEKIVKQPDSLGSILFGDRIYNSPFSIKMLKPENNVKLCSITIPGSDAKFINKLIKNGFFQNWLIDGLPAARKIYDSNTHTEFYDVGFPLGFVEIKKNVGGLGIPMDAKTKDSGKKNSNSDKKKDSKKKDDSQKKEDSNKKEKREPKRISKLVHNVEFPYLANHYVINVEVHDRGEGNYRVVGVTVDPYSTTDSANPEKGNKLFLDEKKDNEVTFSYSVNFIESETVWATRWDKYLHTYNPTIQWFSLVNFSIIVLLLSALVTYSLLKALKSDFARYEEFNLDNSFNEDSGWKLGHGDVFRIPSQSMLLSILVGSGAQLFLMIISSIFLAAIGIISPSSRGSLPSAMFTFYALFGFWGSYISMSVYKFFKGPYWKANMILTPLLVPGFILVSILGLNFFLLFVHSSGTIPMTALLLIVVIWFVISLPLSFLGSLLANKRSNWGEHPTKTNQIARQIPFQSWYLKTIPAILIAGIFPFGAIAVELYFIYTSLWFNKIFYMFGFLFVSFLLLTLTTSLVTVLITYQSLCMENWNWQWRSFTIGGVGCSLYIFIHSILFTKFKLGGFTTMILYIGYTLLLSILSCIVTGAVGFISSMIFVRKIYSNVRVD